MHNHNLNITVPQEKQGSRLDQLLVDLLPQYSRSYLQHQIKSGHIQINLERATKNSARVLAGQHITAHLMAKPIDAAWEADPSIALSIIYEDEALIVVNKPAGLVTHPASGHPNQTLVNALLHHIPHLESLPRAGIIHRLDKDTSGLLVVPKTLVAHTYLVRELATHKMKRVYQAVVKGDVISGGTINAPIGRHPTQRQKQAVVPHGKPAVTHYKIVERFNHHTLLTVQLETGRTHQIRVHMAHLNHGIVGDPVYGGRTLVKVIPCRRQALHAYRLKIRHPMTHQVCCWQAPIPEDMQQLIQTLRENRQ
jgi:23S rRNA pseudouridine1911/1915/1917 synthase